MKKLAALLCAALTFSVMLTGCASNKPAQSEKDETGFVPKLDTAATVELNFASFFGNFEALVKVENDFHNFYPNVSLNIIDNSHPWQEGYWEQNSHVDIFMTSNELGYELDRCVDLEESGVNVSEINDKVIMANKRGGKLYSIPMSLNLKGMVVNKDLLEKEGLKVPETWSEFLSACETLKQKGYTPVQGPEKVSGSNGYSAIGSISYNMGMSMLASDPDLLNAVKSNDAAGAAKLNIIYDRITALISNGYIDSEVNATYPSENYDGAILKFFEGAVPFWVCDTEKVSRMKKRETKSEAFKASPFAYEFIFAPLGDNGAYEFIEPWYGFAVNKNSERKDYAVEFMRFMARADEMNTIASVKGVPSVAKISDDTRYANLGNAKKELAIVSDGSVDIWYGTSICEMTDGIVKGEFTSKEEALQSYLSRFIPEN